MLLLIHQLLWFVEQTTACCRMRNQFDLWWGYKEESYFCTCCLLVFVGHPFRELPYVLQGASGEQLHPGCSSLPGFNPAENLPSGLVLRHHWNRHQHAGSSAGEWSMVENENSDRCYNTRVSLWIARHVWSLWCFRVLSAHTTIICHLMWHQALLIADVSASLIAT